MEKKKLMVVDDSESNTLLIKSLFEEKGNYTVDVLWKSESALDRIRKKKPDIVLLDLMMPQVDGFEILKQMKSDESIKNIPVIVVSAWDSVENIDKALELGAVDYISKPINLIEIYEIVERII